MTPKFITSCYVRIEDKDKRKEVFEELVSLEYYVGQAYICALNEVIVTYPESGTFCTGSEGQFDEIDLNGCLDCGTNAEMFLALAGMREDTDKNQIFIANKDTEAPPLIWGEMFKCSKEKCDGFVFQDPRPRGKEYFIGMGLVRRATAAEIINHYKQKGE